MEPNPLLPQNFVPVLFSEQDAGSGPVAISPNLGPMTGAINNISARNLHEIGNTIPDERNFLRSWRRQLQDCLTQQNARIVKFLIEDVSGAEQASADVQRRCTEILAKYSHPSWNFVSSVRDLTLSTDTSTTMRDIEQELGISPTALREYIKKAIRLYINSAKMLCISETNLEEKLKRLESIVGRINDLMFLEPTAALEQLAVPTRQYLDSVVEKITIEAEYKHLMEQYKKFTVLKGIISISAFQRTPAPTCTICMTSEISQAVTPCGHTFCDSCCRTQMTACYICRVQIRDKVRLYFS
jgi:DNA-binding Lrp family transcriptional regulator